MLPRPSIARMQQQILVCGFWISPSHNLFMLAKFLGLGIGWFCWKLTEQFRVEALLWSFFCRFLRDISHKQIAISGLIGSRHNISFTIIFLQLNCSKLL
jgi:hypothetical protein